MNGSTWFDRTNYYETLPSNRLDLALWLESDRMGWFESAITQEKLDNQRDVVKNERRQSYENRPYGLAVERILERAFPEGHPYHHPTIGYMEDLDRASLEDVRAFFRTFYVPDNAVLVLVGDIESEAAFDLAARYFEEIPRGGGVPRVKAPTPKGAATVAERMHDNVQFPRVYLYHHTPAYGQPGFEAADVLTYMLARGKSSRLYRKLIYEDRIAQDASAQVWPTEDTGLSFIVATARPGVTAEALEEAILGILRRIQRGELEDREVEGARNRALSEVVSELDGVGARSDIIATSATFLDRPDYLNEYFDRLRAVSKEEIIEQANRWFVDDGRVSFHVLPRDQQGREA
jgi:zinc protease